MQIEFKSASMISTGLHAGVLLFAMLTFSGATLEATPPESMPIDLVSTEEFSKLAKGVKDAPKLDIPKPAIEKKAEEPKLIDEIKPKPEEKKKEIQAAKAEPTPPPPEPEKKPDPIAEKLNKKETPQPEAKPEKKVEKLPPKKPPQKPQPKFDPDKIAALLDKRDPVREASAGHEPNQLPSLGAAKGTEARLSQSEIDALRARLRQCWNPPVGVADAAKLSVIFRVIFKRDGSIAGAPTLVQGPASEQGPVLAETARRALLQCQPYTMLKPEHYEMWKDMEITFDPRDMFRG
jgi:outer membrane biosynthesis protein TonB